METNLLVENQIDDGQRLIDQLTREEFQILVAFWLQTSEEGLWQLYLASPLFDSEKMGEAYRKVYSALQKGTPSWVSPSDIKLINGASPVALAAVELRDRHSGRLPTRYHGKRLGNIPIEEAYIYPQQRKWFKGFDEIKLNYPSAEVFTIPILIKDVNAAKQGSLLSRSAEVF